MAEPTAHAPYNAAMQQTYTYVEVEANENTPMSANQVFRNMTEPRAVAAVRLFEGEPDGALFQVTGWSSDGPCPAYSVRVEDSSAGSALLVYGGDWGLRLRPEGSNAAWDLANADQFGETHLVLSDPDDIVLA